MSQISQSLGMSQNSANPAITTQRNRNRRRRRNPGNHQNLNPVTAGLNNLSISEKDQVIATLAQEVGLSVNTLQLLFSIRKPGDRSKQQITTYIDNSSCHPHIKFKISNITSIRRKDEADFPPDNCGKPYRMMLWHGTTRAGVQGILQNHFQRPATTAQLMFGNGIYFADRFSKSAQYCDENKARRPVRGTKGYVLLCDVSLGNRYKARGAKAGATSAQPGYDSFKGQGKKRPDWKENWKYEESIMPIGPTVPDDRFTGHILEFNEYIVYDPARIRLRFLVTVDFL